MAMMARSAAIAAVLIAFASPAARAESWTGLYIGAGGGLAIANHELDFSNGPLAPPPPAFNVNLDGLGGEGGMFTLGVGADYQVNRNVVVGAFFDYDWMEADTSIGASLSGFGLDVAANASFEVESQWSIGGRIGYLPSPRTLLFVSAGYTQVDVSDMTFSAGAAGLGSITGVLASTDTFSGYFIGGGAEIRLTEAISIKGEYRYTDLGSENVTLLPGLAPFINDFVTTRVDTSIQTARIALNYRFGLGHAPSEPDAAPTAAEPAGGWTGFYIGAGGGYAMANHELDFSNGPLAPPPPAFNVNLDGLGGEGGMFTLGVGADYQVNRNVVVGAFFDYDWMEADTSIGASLSGFGLDVAANASFEVESQWSIGGRIGYLPSPRTLLFVSAGYTQVDVSDMTFSAGAAGLGSITGVLASTDTFSGYFIGGGAEIRLTEAISIKGEYRYTDLGSENVTLLPGLAPFINDFVRTELDPSIHTARLSFVYRFNREAPPLEPLK